MSSCGNVKGDFQHHLPSHHPLFNPLLRTTEYLTTLTLRINTSRSAEHKTLSYFETGRGSEVVTQTLFEDDQPPDNCLAYISLL